MAAHRKYSLSDWPTADQAAWLAATSDDGSLLYEGDRAHWRAPTRRNAYYAYCGWLVFLSQHHAESLLQSPSERLSDTRLNQYLDALAARVIVKTKSRPITAESVAACVGHLTMAFHAVAPGYDTTWLRQRQYRFARGAERKEKRHRMVPAAKLYELGMLLMDQAETLSNLDEAALAFRDGLIIAVLTATAMRRKNLTELLVSGHLQRIGERYALYVDAKETKSTKPIDHHLSTNLTPYVDRYLSHYRLHFRRAREHDGMWPSMKGGPLCPAAIWAAVARRTRTAFGHSINLHLFRDIAVTTISLEPQARFSMARDLLGHTELATTDEHYRRTDCLGASRRHASLIGAMRANEVGVTPGTDEICVNDSDDAVTTPDNRFRVGRAIA